MSDIAKSGDVPTEIMLIKPDVNHVLIVAAQLQNRLLDYRDHIVLRHHRIQPGNIAGFDHAENLAYLAENFAVSTKLVEIEQALMYVIGIRSFLDSWSKQQHHDMHSALDLIGKARAFLNSRPSYPNIVTYGDDMFIRPWDESADDSQAGTVISEGDGYGC